MSLGLVNSIVEQIGVTFEHLAPYLVFAGVVFPILTTRYACNNTGPWWRSRELMTDLCYWFVVPVFTRFLRIGLLVLGAALLFGITEEKQLIAFFDRGHGPWAALPFWAQVSIYLIFSDVLLYWSHRLFHNAPLWKYHAVHHSSEVVEWTSAARFHPVNLSLGTVLVDVVLLLSGIPPLVLSVLVPFNVFMSVFVHANLNWSLGPFKYLLASPVFHRWHHTGPDQGETRTLPVRFLSSTCCSARSTCRQKSCRATTGSTCRTSPRASAANFCTRSKDEQRRRASALALAAWQRA